MSLSELTQLGTVIGAAISVVWSLRSKLAAIELRLAVLEHLVRGPRHGQPG